MNETAHFLPKIAKRMIDLVPAVAGLKVRRQWRGLYANTTDGNPLVGFDTQNPNGGGYEGLYHAVGMGGQGFMLGGGLGKLLVRLLSGKKGQYDDVAMEEFNPHRVFKVGEELLR